THDPYAWIVHFNDGADALPGAEEEGFDCGGIGDWVAVERDDLEFMATERDAAVLGGACGAEVEEDALTLAHAKGFADAEGSIVDGVSGGGDLKAVGCRVEDLRLFGLRGVGVVHLVHVDHLGGEEGVPVAESEEEFLIVGAGI